MLSGLGFWVLFCVAMVFVRGTRWDEHWDLAQVILGRIPYPEDHFLYIWTRDVRNLPIFLSTAVAWITDGPGVLNGLRNVLWLFATVLPAFVLGYGLTRRVLVGHVAVVLVLTGMYGDFDASYPIYAWPAYFSNGHTGMGYGLIALGLLLAGWSRSAALMIGFMPAVHIAHMPPVAGVALFAAFWLWRSGEQARVRRALIWLIPGLALSAVLWLIPMDIAAPTSGAYFADGDSEQIARAYMAQGTHWSKPGVAASHANSNFVLASMLLLSLGMARSELGSGRRVGAWTGLSLYVGLCAAAVWTMMAVHVLLDERVPYSLLAAMPYRLANHATVLSLVILPAVLLKESWRSSGSWLFVGVLLVECVRVALRSVWDSELYTRYLASGEAVVYLMVGIAAALILMDLRRDRRLSFAWLGLWAVVLISVSLRHQYGAACFVLGATTVGLLSLAQRSERFPVRLWQSRAAIATLTGIVLIRIVFEQWSYRETLPLSDFDRAVTEYLDGRDEPGAMLVSYPQQHRLQSRTGHAVLADSASADSMVYSPQLAPSIQKIYDELWGIRFYPSGDPSRPSWDSIWRARSGRDWTDLGERYGFSYVISPNDVPLELEVLLAGTNDTLYRVAP